MPKLVIMDQVIYREAKDYDLGSIAALRSGPENSDYWRKRVKGYFNKTSHPTQSLLPRVLYVATIDGKVAGFIAGHLTTRFNCQGELQWINTDPAYQHRGIATRLLTLLAEWFQQNGASLVCVDPGTEEAKAFYRSRGAKDLNEHWMVWENIGKIG
jgi:ribosomal protein S18 acetylase RimI-like enzyme